MQLCSCTAVAFVALSGSGGILLAFVATNARVFDERAASVGPRLCEPVAPPSRPPRHALCLWKINSIEMYWLFCGCGFSRSAKNDVLAQGFKQGYEYAPSFRPYHTCHARHTGNTGRAVLSVSCSTSAPKHDEAY